MPDPAIAFTTADANQLIATKNLGVRVYSHLVRGKWYEFKVNLNGKTITKDFIMPLSGGLSFRVDFYN